MKDDADIVVFGGGGAGLTAALVAASEGLRVILCEKTDQLGGTTATSGGTIWVPGSTQSRRTKTPDSVDAARTYLDGEIGPEGAALREAFFAAGAPMLDYLERRTDVKFVANSPYPDYHAEQPGGARGGRALSALEFDARLLGKDFALVRAPIPEFLVLAGMMVARSEIPHLTRPFASKAALATTLRLLARHASDRLRYPRGTRLVLGNALVARLVYSVLRARVDVRLGTRLVELVHEGGRVTGARVEHADVTGTLTASKGVVLATGGCAASPQWRAELAGREVAHTLAFEGATGDGLEAARAAGARIDRSHDDRFYWMPASTMHWPSGRTATYPHIRDRPKPGLIAVNKAGRRFVNEANSYHDFVEAMLAADAKVPSIPAYLICDRAFIFDYGLGVIHPRRRSLRAFVESRYLVEAPTLAELARRIGVDADGLADSVATHNRDAASGTDTAFGRGSTALNRHNGDAANKPNPCLRPIAKAPFYAVAVNPAPIASSAGLATDADGRVLAGDGAPIAGLYACGNDMSSIMRGHYAGPGITLGPAMVFAFRIAMHAAGHPLPATIPAGVRDGAAALTS